MHLGLEIFKPPKLPDVGYNVQRCTGVPQTSLFDVIHLRDIITHPESILFVGTSLFGNFACIFLLFFPPAGSVAVTVILKVTAPLLQLAGSACGAFHQAFEAHNLRTSCSRIIHTTVGVNFVPCAFLTLSSNTVAHVISMSS